MKRFWIGAGLLAVLLVLGLLAMGTTDAVHGSIAEDLHQAAQAAQKSDWAQADALTDSAKAEWDENWYFTAALADHTVIDEIDAIFAEIEIFRTNRDSTACAASCVRLSELIDALKEGHRPSWWNLL